MHVRMAFARVHLGLQPPVGVEHLNPLISLASALVLATGALTVMAAPRTAALLMALLVLIETLAGSFFMYLHLRHGLDPLRSRPRSHRRSGADLCWWPFELALALLVALVVINRA